MSNISSLQQLYGTPVRYSTGGIWETTKPNNDSKSCAEGFFFKLKDKDDKAIFDMTNGLDGLRKVVAGNPGNIKRRAPENIEKLSSSTALELFQGLDAQMATATAPFCDEKLFQ